MNTTHSLKPSELKVGDLIEVQYPGNQYDFIKLRSIEIKANGRFVLKFGKYKETVADNVRYHICRIGTKVLL